MKIKMFKFSYDVELCNTCTVREFIDDMLSQRKYDYGFILISSSIFKGKTYRYKDGKIISDPIEADILDKYVLSADAYGYSFNKDYFLRI